MLARRLAAEIEAQRVLLRTRAGRGLAAGLGALALLTVVGLAVLWPGDTVLQRAGTSFISRGIVPAEVTAVIGRDCPVENTPGCKRVDIRLKGGPRKGATSYVVMPGDDATPRLSPGDDIRVSPNLQSFSEVPADPLAGSDPSQAPFGYVDFERRSPLALLALAFAALVIVLGRRVGLLSLLGLVIGLLTVTAFVVPAILDGSSPFPSRSSARSRRCSRRSCWSTGSGPRASPRCWARRSASWLRRCWRRSSSSSPISPARSARTRASCAA